MKIKKVLILAPYSPDQIHILKKYGINVEINNWLETEVLQDPEELGKKLNSGCFEAVVVEGDFLFKETFNAAPKIKFAGICRNSINNIDLNSATSKGVIIVNTPQRNSTAVAEMTIALMLSVIRRLPESDSYIRRGRWESPISAYIHLRGSELSGKTIGVIGLGSIGSKVAKLSQAFGMSVIAYDPYIKDTNLEELDARLVDLSYLLKTSDVVSLHATQPANGEPIIDYSNIKLMRKGALIINTAGSELINQQCLIDALTTGELSGAGLDVFPSHPIEPENQLLKLKNVVLTPHIGGATSETINRHSNAMTQDIIAFASGNRPINMVNPEVWDLLYG